MKNNTDTSPAIYDYQNGEMTIEGILARELVEEFGSPLYVYSERYILDRIDQYFQGNTTGLPLQISYAIKANSNQTLLRSIQARGCGADIVSGGELYRALRAGFDPRLIVFSGVGKTDREVQEALEAGIGLFSIESEAELHHIANIARQMGKQAPFSIRVNPDVNANTHPYISTGLKENKFGIEQERVVDLYLQASRTGFLEPRGIGFHIGSQLTETDPHLEAIDRILELRDVLQNVGITINHIDVGGGLGIRYGQYDNPPAIGDFVGRIMERISRKAPGVSVVMEPGRSVVGNAGILLTKILYTKFNGQKRFQICDAAMNDLIRPSLYGATHGILPVRENTRDLIGVSDLVGPVCETGDFLVKDEILPDFQSGDLAALVSAGAYGMVMASNYNSRPRAAEVMIGLEGQAKLIRRRETYEDLIALEEQALRSE